MEVTFKWQEQSHGGWQPRRKTVKTTGDKTVLGLAREQDIKIEAMCGGRGRCGRCKVFVHGPTNEVIASEELMLSKEELAGGVRLACYVRPQGDIEIEIPTSKTELMQILTEGAEQTVPLAPDITKTYLVVKKPELETPQGDRERLLSVAGSDITELSLGAMAELPEVLRKQDHKVTITRWQERIVAIESGDTTSELYGMAVDIGTTTVVGSLVDLHKGEEIAVAARLNGQAAYGSDVISRIEYASSGTSQGRRLQKSVMDTLNGIVTELEERTGIAGRRIARVILVGNTCMQHLAMGVSPTYIARAPYVPGFSHRIDVTAAQLGLTVHPDAPVTFLPNVAGFVGADTVGVVLATNMAHESHRVLMIDVGTNGELVMSNGGKMVACSTAAGPAFEGTQITWGMRAGEGAIEVVTINGDVETQVIGGTRPRGMCGSGIIDLVAELLKVDIIDDTGRLRDSAEIHSLPEQLSSRVRSGEAGNEFVVAWAHETAEGSDIVISQRDIRELQLAKGAIRAGTAILLKLLGLEDTDIDELLLAGAFGNYLRKESAVAIGLLPQIPLCKIRSVGNAARVGAKLCLLSEAYLEEASRLANAMDYVELSGRSDFQEAFMEAMMFPLLSTNGQDSTEINKKLPRDQTG
ncbi:MAG: ATP-binding protein [Firmicutes bacterium]|nr:ATP-binding protein [Bacillota bacterium]